jgi:hypothetical protein
LVKVLKFAVLICMRGGEVMTVAAKFLWIVLSPEVVYTVVCMCVGSVV